MDSLEGLDLHLRIGPVSIVQETLADRRWRTFDSSNSNGVISLLNLKYLGMLLVDFEVIYGDFCVFLRFRSVYDVVIR